ncbi:MAG: Flavin reductase domain protein FMN-binding protein [Desulfotomaculum sp. 46_296]|nr:MAG: Flavin reductase domain protein FMN-binding protein [Desulfotomaculum sp. 46_296]
MDKDFINLAARSLVWPVCLVGAIENEKHNIMTVAWITQISANPLQLVISIDKSRYTHNMISETGEFMVSILSSEQKEIAAVCGSRSGRNVDKIKQLKIETVPSTVVKVPRLAGCLANMECKVVAQYPAGGRTLFVGEVVAADVGKENLKPMIMYRGKYIG